MSKSAAKHGQAVNYLKIFYWSESVTIPGRRLHIIMMGSHSFFDVFLRTEEEGCLFGGVVGMFGRMDGWIDDDDNIY